MRKKFQPRVLYDTSKATKIMGQLQGRNDRSSALRINRTISNRCTKDGYLTRSTIHHGFQIVHPIFGSRIDEGEGDIL